MPEAGDTGRSGPAVTPHWRTAAVIVALVAVLAGTALVQSLRTAALDPLAPSSPAETVARAARLAGIHAIEVTGRSGTARAHVEAGRFSSAADVEIAYQAVFASLAAAWPGAREYVVVLTWRDQARVELGVDGAALRAAVETEDAGALLGAVRVMRIAPLEPTSAETREEPAEATAAPGDDVWLRGAYLDAKNRAAGLLGDEGPAGETARRLALSAERAREDAPGVPAPRPGESAFALHASRAQTAIAALERDRGSVDGADALREWLAATAPAASRDDAAVARGWAAVAEAFAAAEPLGSVLADAHALAGSIAASPLAPGPPADAVLVEADDPAAPASAREMDRFERVETLDWALWSSASPLPAFVFDRVGTGGTAPPTLMWADPSGAGAQSVQPETWVAYRRADGRVYWRAGSDGEVALTDASLLGWAFSERRAVLVDAADVGKVRATFPLE